MRKRIFLILYLIFALIMVGCGEHITTKTFVLKDEVLEEEEEDEGLEYTVKKISDISGGNSWIKDSNEIVRFINNDENQQYIVQNYDYESKFYEELFTLPYEEGDILSVSPNGEYIIYQKITNKKVNHYIKKRGEDKARDLLPEDIGYSGIFFITWTDDSRYVSFVCNGSKERTYIYNYEENYLKKIGELSGDEKYINSYIAPSGKYAITQGMNPIKNKYMTYIEDGSANKKLIKTEEFIYKVEFINDDEAIVIDNNKLYWLSNLKGEINKKELSGINKFYNFTLSNDGTTIVFTLKDSFGEVYIGKLDNEGLSKNKLLYKGEGGFPNLYFNDDSTKILINRFLKWNYKSYSDKSTVIEIQ